MKIVAVSGKGTEYSQRFTTVDEAFTDAKKMSRELGIELKVVKSGSIFYVHSDNNVWEWETLIASFFDGKKLK